MKRRGMRETKKITLSAMMCALTVVILVIASYLGDLDLTVMMLSSFPMVFVYLEIGVPYTYLTWVASTLLTGILFPSQYIFILYFFVFGIYPILKGYFEKLPKGLWLPVKLVWFAAALAVLLLLLKWLFGIGIFDEGKWLGITLLVLAAVSFVAYDFFITIVVRLYVAKYREKLQKFLK